MTVRRIRAYINGVEVSGLEFLTINRGHGNSISSLIFTVPDKLFSIGDLVYVDIDVSGNTYRGFYGYVKSYDYQNKDGIYEYNAFGVLVRAKDNFIASSTPDTSYKIFNKSIESLIGDLLNMSHIYNYIYDPTNFYLAVTHEYEINLINAYDMISQAKKIIAWEVWDDEYGNVYLKDRKPYIMPSDTSYMIIDSFIDFDLNINDTDLRNRVVIYGDNVYSEAKTSSSYLPTGYYKTVVLASNLIQSQTFADLAADYNLNALNRLTEELTLVKEIVPFVEPFKVITLSTGISDIDGDWYVYNVTTEVRLNSGAIQTLSLRR